MLVWPPRSCGNSRVSINIGENRVAREGAAYPDVEVEILVCDRLDIETNRRDGGNDFADLDGHG